MRDYVKYAGILFAITFVTALLLGVVNNFTAPVIEKFKAEKMVAAIEVVVEGSIDMTTEEKYQVEGESSVQEITSYMNDKGSRVYAVKAVPVGYAGDIEMMVGINSQGLVTGVEIINMSETAGLGANAKGNTEWLAQFLGNGKDKLDSITGATITSKAIQKGVNDARVQVEKIAGGVAVE